MRKLIATAALVLPLVFTANIASAAPTVQVAGGDTTVRLSDSFVGALSGLSVAPAAIAPGKLRANKRGVFIKYRIPGGALDAADYRGDIFHVGGLSLTAGDTVVELLNFVIDTQDEPVLTGVVAVNGDLVGRLPLFNLELTSLPVVEGNGKVTISDVAVTLTDGAAGALNGIFGIDALAGGFDIGTARVKTRIVDAGDDDSSDDDNSSD